MRYALDHKHATRARILDAAGRRLRRDGLALASVKQVMRDVGLTMGGFYAHFRSRRALLAHALRELMRERRDQTVRLVADRKGNAALLAFARHYVTRANRDRVETGCPVAPILSELPRADAALRKVLVEELDALVEVLATAQGTEKGRERALQTLARSFGALILARATDGTPLSEEILDACS